MSWYQYWHGLVPVGAMVFSAPLFCIGHAVRDSAARSSFGVPIHSKPNAVKNWGAICLRSVIGKGKFALIQFTHIDIQLIICIGEFILHDVRENMRIGGIYASTWKYCTIRIYGCYKFSLPTEEILSFPSNYLSIYFPSNTVNYYFHYKITYNKIDKIIVILLLLLFFFQTYTYFEIVKSVLKTAT